MKIKKKKVQLKKQLSGLGIDFDNVITDFSVSGPFDQFFGLRKRKIAAILPFQPG